MDLQEIQQILQTYNLTAFCKKHDLKYDYVRQALNGTRKMGTKTLQKLEEAIRKEKGLLKT